MYVSDFIKREVCNIFEAKYFFYSSYSNTQRHKYSIPRLISQITVNTVAQWCFQNTAVCFRIQAKLTQQHCPNQWHDIRVELPVRLTEWEMRRVFMFKKQHLFRQLCTVHKRHPSLLNLAVELQV